VRFRIDASNPQPVAVAVALEPVADGERRAVTKPVADGERSTDGERRDAVRRAWWTDDCPAQSDPVRP